MNLEDDYMCFACGKNNPIGLHLKFDINREKQEIKTVFTPGKNYKGYKDIVHCGIISTVLDEVMVNLAYRLGKPCVSTEIKLRLKKFALVNQEITFKGKLLEEKGRLIMAESEARTADGTIIATAQGKLFKIDKVNQKAN